MTPYFKELLSYGALGVFMAFVLFMVWRYGPKLLDGHLDFLNHTKKCNEENTKVNQNLSATMGGVAETMKVLATTVATKMDPQGDPKYDDHSFSTVHTNKALAHLCEALQEIIHEHPACEKAGPHIEKAIAELRHLRHHS